MSQHSHPRSQRGSVGKSPSCQEEEENALQEHPPGSTLDELQRQVEEELRSSDQVLSRIGSKYSRPNSPLAAERSYHDSFVENSQMNNYQSAPRTPVSIRSRRGSPVTSSGGVAFATTDDFNKSSMMEDSNFMESPLEESCDKEDQFLTSPEKEAYYNPMVNETSMVTDKSESYVHGGSLAPATSGFRSSLERIQSTPISMLNESNHRNTSGPSMMLNDQNFNELSSTMGSAGRSPSIVGPSGIGSTSIRSAAMGSAIRTPSSRVGCTESNCERIYQGLESSARSTSRSIKVDSREESIPSQYFIERNNQNASTKYLNFSDEMPRSQGALSTGPGGAGANETFPVSRNDSPEAMSTSYQRPPSLEATFRCQSYQTSQNPVVEVRGVPCPRSQSSRLGTGGQLCTTSQSSRPGTMCQPYHLKTPNCEGGAGSQFEQAQNFRAVTFDNGFLRSPGLEVGGANQTHLVSRNGSPEPGSPGQRPQNIEATFGNQCQITEGFRAEAAPQRYQRVQNPRVEAGGQLCQTQDTSRASNQICPAAPASSLRTDGGIHLYQKTPSHGEGGAGQTCQTGLSPQAEVWDDSRTQRFEGRRANTLFPGNLSPIPEVCIPYEKSSSIQAPLGSQLCQTQCNTKTQLGVQHFQRTNPVPQAQALSKPCHLPVTTRTVAGGQHHQKVQCSMAQAQAMGQKYQSSRSPKVPTEDQQYQRVQCPMVQIQAKGGGQPCESPRSPRAEDQQYQRGQSSASQMQAQTESLPCQSPEGPRAVTGIQPCQEENPMAEPWDNYYLYPPSSLPGGEGQCSASLPNPGAGGGYHPYQRVPNLEGKTSSGHAHQKAQSPTVVGGNHSHHGGHIKGSHQMESAHHDHHNHHGHSRRVHPPNEKRSQALYRLSQLKKTPSLSKCKIENDLDFLNICCSKAKTAEKMVKIPERPCLKRQEIENLVRCESRDVDDALLVSADVSTTYKKPCPKQQKAQMSVQALVQAHAKNICQPTYTPLEHPDPEDITPELAAAMMFSQEQGLKMEECPYDIVAHLYPEPPETPFQRKSRQSNVSVVDGQKEEEEIIEKSASVPSEGVSDSVFSRKMKERGEEIEARSSYDVEFAIGQTKRQYVLVTQNPVRVNKIQFRGGSSPLWFPGYFSAFPDEPGLNLVPSPSEVFQKAWVHSNPKNMPTNDVIVLD